MYLLGGNILLLSITYSLSEIFGPLDDPTLLSTANRVNIKNTKIVNFYEFYP